MRKKIYTADRESGYIIVEFDTVEEALAAIEEYEQTDKEEGTFTPNFYDVVDDERQSLLI